jgi:hypothetical protein
MTDLEKEQLNAGAPDYKKKQDEMERQIRQEVEKELGHLSPAARETVIRSRLNIQSDIERPELVKVDLGENAGKKVKDTLFE